MRQLALLDTVTQNRMGGLSRNAFPPTLRRDSIKDFNFARDAAVFREMAQSAEADQLRIIFETYRPETEAVIYETFNTAFNNGDGRLSRNDLIVPQKLPHTRINPKTMQIINVVNCELTNYQPRSFYHCKTIGDKPMVYSPRLCPLCDAGASAGVTQWTKSAPFFDVISR